MPANDYILKTRRMSHTHLINLLKRLARAAEAGADACDMDALERGLGFHLGYLEECMRDVLREQDYLDRLHEEIEKQEKHGD